MTRNIPEPPPQPALNRDAHAALDELLRRANLHRSTGKAILTIDLNQGGARAVRIGIEETYKPT